MKLILAVVAAAGAAHGFLGGSVQRVERVPGTEHASTVSISPDDRWLLVGIKSRLPLPPPSADRPDVEALRRAYPDEPRTTLVLIERATGRRRVVDAAPFDSIAHLDGHGVPTVVTILDQFERACWSADNTRCYFPIRLRRPGDGAPPGAPPPLTIVELDIADPERPRLTRYQGTALAASRYVAIDSGRGRCSDCWDAPARDVALRLGAGTVYSRDRRFAYQHRRAGKRASVVEIDLRTGRERSVATYTGLLFEPFASVAMPSPDGRTLLVLRTGLWGSFVARSTLYAVDVRGGSAEALEGLDANARPAAWTSDSKVLYLLDIDRRTGTWHLVRWQARE